MLSGHKLTVCYLLPNEIKELEKLDQAISVAYAKKHKYYCNYLKEAGVDSKNGSIEFEDGKALIRVFTNKIITTNKIKYKKRSK